MPYCTVRRIIVRACLLALLVFHPWLGATAQGTRGIEFWTGFMTNVSTTGISGDLSIYITSRVNVTGIISIPRIGWTKNFGVSANSGTLVTLPSNLIMSYGSEGVENKGVHIVATDTVDIFGMNYSPQTVDASLIFAVDALGTDYRVMAYAGSASTDGPVPSQFLVVATADATQIEITPTSPTLAGHAAGVPFTVKLDAGQVYQVQSAIDLTGSLVRSTNGKPIAVMGGAMAALIPAGILYRDHVYEQLYPIDRWGTSFISIPLKTRSSDTYRVVAATDSTVVTIDGANLFTLNAGQFKEFMLSAPSVIASSQPVSVAEFSNSSQYDLIALADPFMVMLNPTDFMRRELRFYSFPEPTISKHYVNIVTLTNSLSSVRLDGVQVGAQFQPVPSDPFFSWAQIEVSAGEHVLSSFFGAIAYVYGFGLLESYGYSTGAERLVPCPYPSIMALGDTVFCDGQSVVLDAGGGYDNYRWSNDSTSRSITVTTTGQYYVVTLDSNGCERPSRPVNVTVHAKPPAIISTSSSGTICPCDSATLLAPPGYRYQWTTGDTTQSISVRAAGSYGVTVIDTLGCTSVATPVTIAVDDRPATVALASNSARPGEQLTVPLYIVDQGSIAACGVRDFTATVRYDRSLLILNGIDGASIGGTSDAGVERVITISGHRAGDTLARIAFTAALGSSESAALKLESFRWDDCAGVRTDTAGGRFQLNDICREGGPRLIEVNGGTALKSSRPNPAGTIAMIDYTVGEAGTIDLYLTDLLGKRVATLASAIVTPGDYEARLDASALPAGTYICVLQTPTQRMSVMVRVLR